MGTIDDINFDTDYLYPTFRFLLLDNKTSNEIGPSPVILLSHISLLTLIEVFNDLFECQNYINDNPRKIITLIISDRKIIEWNNNINIINNNIRKVYIFCHLYEDFLTMKVWHGCYQAQIQDVYLPDKLEYNLLRLGVDYIHDIMPEFKERGLRRKFCRHAKELLRALEDYYDNEMDNIDDEEGVENS